MVFVCGCGAINGTFNSVVSSSPFFAATADYSVPENVNVTLTRLAFGSVPGLTSNEQAVGKVLEQNFSTSLTGDAATFYSTLLSSTSTNVLDQISGQGTSATQNASFNTGTLFNQTMMNETAF